MKTVMLVAFATLVCSTPAFAWDGTDQESGESVEIESGNTVRSGNDIEIYDYGDGSYHDVTVNSIDRDGSTVSLDVDDSTTGESRTLEMDDE